MFASGAVAANELDDGWAPRALELADFPRDVVLVGPLPPGISESAWRTAATQAVEAWNSVRCSEAILRYEGRVDHIADAPADATTVAFVDATSERCFVEPSNLGLTLITPCDDWSRGAVLLRTNGVAWHDAPQPYEAPEALAVDVRSVLTHELGHVLGIGHDDVSDPLATMAPRYLRDGGLATLAADDKLALCELYPAANGECASDAGCAGACVERGGFSVCDEVRVEPGGYCDLAELNCANGAPCLVTSSATYSGYCSPTCSGDGDCPSGMACDDGQCQFVATPQAAGGCSVAAQDTRDAFPLGLLIIAARRRRPAGSRNRPSMHRGPRH